MKLSLKKVKFKMQKINKNMNQTRKLQQKSLFKKLHIAISWILLINLFVVGWPGQALAASGDGLLSYGSSTSTYSFYQTWAAAGTWGGQTGGPSITCSSGVPTINWEVLKADPSTPDRYILGVMYSCATPATYFTAFYNYSGGAWTSEFSVSTSVGQQTYRGMDIEFERSSGNVVLVYEKSASATTYYYREGTWGGANYGLSGASEGSGTFTNTIGNHRWYILTPQLNADNLIFLAAGDAGATRNVVARVWDGSTFGTETPDLGMAYVTTNWDFDCAYETNTGEGLCAWGFSGTPYWKYITFTSGAWNAVTSGDTTNQTSSLGMRVLDLDANPNPDATYGDDIAVGFIEDNTTDDADATIWTGAAWSAVGSLDNAVYSTATGRQAAVKYASNSNSAIVLYDDANTADTDWAISANGAAFGAVTSTVTAGGQDSNIQLINESTDDKIMFMREDGGANLDLYAYEFDMSANTWTATNGGAALNATLTNGAVGEPYMFAYNTPYKVPTLGEILFLALVGCVVFIGVKSGVIKLGPKKKVPNDKDEDITKKDQDNSPSGRVGNNGIFKG